MENLNLLLSLIGTICGLAITVLTFLYKMIKSARAKIKIEQAIKISNAVLPFIKEAEKFTAYSGEEKKAYVLTKANQFALTNNLKFNENQVSEKIEELVMLTKQVNAKTSTKDKNEIAKEIKKITQGKWL
jgi:hypothetical protein